MSETEEKGYPSQFSRSHPEPQGPAPSAASFYGQALLGGCHVRCISSGVDEECRNTRALMEAAGPHGACAVGKFEYRPSL